MITTEDIIKATGGDTLSLDEHRSFTGVSIDSRTIRDGEVFFAIRGENFDGHNFVSDALTRGTGAVIDSPLRDRYEDKVIIHVEDTLRALQDLAHFLRMKRNIPVIAITGSNGKTTTKEMAYTILSGRFRVLKNEGNLNNHIGLPLSLTRIAENDQMVVLELGMNASGEIRRLCEIARPTHGIITNIGPAHIGELGSLESIRDAKLEIMDGLTVTVLNADDDFLMDGYSKALAEGRINGRLITFSVRNNSHVQARNVVTDPDGSSFTLTLQDGKHAVITLRIRGLFNVYNALAASAVCISLEMSLGEIQRALEGYVAFPMRFEVVRLGSFTLINDAYNANPVSVRESLRELVRMKGERRAVAVLGDMYELGKHSERLHREVGRTVDELGIDVFVSVGAMMGLAAKEAQKKAESGSGRKKSADVISFQSVEAAGRNISAILREGDVVLIKGSRIMGMERLIENIRGHHAL